MELNIHILTTPLGGNDKDEKQKLFGIWKIRSSWTLFSRWRIRSDDCRWHWYLQKYSLCLDQVRTDWAGYGRVYSQNFRMLEAKVKRLEGIVEILQIANCTANAPLNEKLQALEELHGQYNVHMLCDALKVPRGTFYNYIFRNKRDNTWYAKRREELRIRIQQIYDESKQIFGAGKITAVMKEEGYKVSQEMVRELMRDMGLLSIRQDAKKVYAKERRSLKII